MVLNTEINLILKILIQTKETLNVTLPKNMKILHCCLAAIYADSHGYQENILPKMHKLQGHDVMIVASTETFIDNNKSEYVQPSSYITEYGVPITRLPYTDWIPQKIVRKLRIYKGLSEILFTFKPDCVFLHGVQFISIREVVAYVKKQTHVRVYVDGHSDYVNSARNWFSKNILHKVIYKWCAKLIEPYTIKFWGTLPIREEFFIDMYGINPNKVDLLVMGGDISKSKIEEKDLIRNKIRQKCDIDKNTFLIISGGKIDKLKNIHLLMKAVNNIAKNDINLLVFGNISEDLATEFRDLSQSKYIKYIGWISSKDVYDYYLASDLAFFPGTHSVLWEQSISVGLPGVFKRWEGIQHIDLGGNVLFLDTISVEEIEKIILKVYNDIELYEKMKRVSENLGFSTFSYYEIAQKAIGEGIN